jgi:predicted porin
LDAFTLRGTYAQTKFDTTNRKIAITGLGVDYNLTPALMLTGAFYNTKQTGINDGVSKQYLAIGKYALSKRTSIYSSLTHATAGSTGVNDTSLAPGLISAGNDSANRFSVGVTHTF